MHVPPSPRGARKIGEVTPGVCGPRYHLGGGMEEGRLKGGHFHYIVILCGNLDTTLVRAFFSVKFTPMNHWQEVAGRVVGYSLSSDIRIIIILS